MPELPEVEVVRRQLREHILGKTISGVTVHHEKTTGYDPQFQEKLCGLTIADIDRVGKLLIFSFVSEPDRFLLAHLKMTGQFFYVDPKQHVYGGGHSHTPIDTAHLPGRHTRVSITFSDQTALHFNDMRLFGYTRVTSAEGVAGARRLFGPEPHTDEFDTDWFIRTVRKRRAPIKAVLLDQGYIAGLGNIYVDEALFRAQVRPTRRADRLTKKEASALAAAAGDVLRESISKGGTTFQNFLDTDGRTGNFSDELQVFDRTGLPCPRCKTPIKKIRAAGRGTHYCPRCQR